MELYVAILVGVFGGLFLLGLAACACYCLVCNKKRRPATDAEKYSHLEKKNINNKGKANAGYDNAKGKHDYVNYPVPVSSPTVSEENEGYINKKAVKNKKPTFNIQKVFESALVKSVNTYVIDDKRLKLDEIIGQGQFGVVYKGILTDKTQQGPITVAVKTVQGDDCTQEDVSSFLEEGLRMRGYQHPNVLTLIGLVFRDNLPYVVLPFMKNGDLRSYIADPNNTLTVHNLLEFGIQVADGMAYLAGQSFVHRDLAARNCMVDEGRTVKIADFGLSRDLFNADYYLVEEKSRPLPIRWMAVDCMKTFKFSSKSDVWSYGVLLWELFTRGKKPYPTLDNSQVIAYVRKGERLRKPPFAPEPIYKVMMSCWHKDPDARLSFGELSSSLKTLIQPLTGTNYSGANTLQREYLQVIDPANPNSPSTSATSY